MLNIKVEVSSNLQRIEISMFRVRNSTNQVIGRAGKIGAQSLLNALRQITPRRSGTLASSWEAKIVPQGAHGVRVDITNSAAHWKYVKSGTGIFGPRKRIIRSKKTYTTRSGKTRRMPLIFQKEGRIHYSMHSRGTPANDPTKKVNRDQIARQVAEETKRGIVELLGRS